MAALSEVAICRLALDLIGDYAITDLDDETEQARLCKRNYPAMRDAVVRAHPWNCALTRKNLPKDEQAPEFGYAFQYTLPADCLRVLDPRVDGVGYGAPIEHKVEGRKILTNYDAPFPCHYLRIVKDTGTFDSLLVNAIAARLAWQIAYNLTGSRTKQADVAANYQGILSEARRIDGLEGSSDDQEGSEWLASRAGGW